MKKANKHLSVNTIDLPVIDKFVFEFLVEPGMIDHVNVISGDFFLDDFPKSDIIMMRIILHNWNLEREQFSIKKAFNRLMIIVFYCS